MAIKALLLKRQIDEKNIRMAELSAKTEELRQREMELETAVGEAKTEEELRSVSELADSFDVERRQHQEKVASLQTEIDGLIEQLRALEAQQPPRPVGQKGEPLPAAERNDDYMPSKKNRAFGGMTLEQRSAFIKRDDVQEFLTRFRSMFSSERFEGGPAQNRAISGGELMIPDVILELLRQNIEDYSKLIRRVRLVSVSGKARQNIIGTIPEAIWTEMCAALNELNFTLNNVEVDGYKVGGYVAICNALLEDTDYVLLSEIIAALGASIGIALDKAILYGTGVKMPLGIAPRLAQTAQPSAYPETARPWQNLSQSNVITIPSDAMTGLTLFQKIILAAAASKGRYSRGERFWAMNEATYTTLQVEATAVNAAGAIVSVMDGKMPVAGGDIVVFSDDIIPDNTIIGGYGDLYLLAERAGTSVGYSDLPLYLQDQTVAKATARYDGKPVIPEGFVVIGLGRAPVLSIPFAPDVANPSVAALRALSLGSLTLSPAFNPETDTYSASTANASNAISAVPAVGAVAAIKLNGKPVQNGSALTWKDGENTVAVSVTNGNATKTYSITVTKGETV